MQFAETNSLFSVPSLGDLPTDPIVANLPILSVAFTKQHQSKPSPWATSLLQSSPPEDELDKDVKDETSSIAISSDSEIKTTWEDDVAGSEPPSYLAWNAPPSTSTSAFASERQPFNAQPPGSSSSSTVTPISAASLIPLLLQVALGSSKAGSVLWNESKKRFKWVGEVGNLSAQATDSFIRPFLETGTWLIRLSELAALLAVSPLSSSSTHAFAHSLSGYLTFLRDELQSAANATQSPSRKGKERESAQGPLQLQQRWRVLGEVVSGLAALGGVNKPHPVKPSSSLYSTSSLLTRIYCHLTSHVDSGSSIHLQAALAWLLDRTSVLWVDKVGQWIGLLPEDGETERDGWKEVGAEKLQLEKDVFDYQFDPVAAPAFVSPGAARDIFEAGRSLRLLRQARPDHPLCTALGWGEGESSRPRWMWSEEEISELHDSVQLLSKELQKDVSSWRRRLRRVRPSNYAEQTQFNLRLKTLTPSTRSIVQRPTALFGSSTLNFASLLDPCTRPPGFHSGSLFHLASSTPPHDEDNPETAFTSTPSRPPPPRDVRTFLAHLLSFHSSFSPNLLPPSAPSVPILTSLTVFPSLLSYGSLVSQSLLSIYFFDLRLLAHLEVLNRFLLLSDPAFTSRVKAALFGDGDDATRSSRSVGQGARSRTRARLGMTPSKKKSAQEAKSSEWGVGLGVGLSDRQVWPPGGAELALALRATMLDSVGELVKEKEVEAKWNGETRRKGEKGANVWDEVEGRLGFAVRSKEESEKEGREGWRDPQSIEALDFLYINYRLPPTIAVLFPLEILAKYHRIQTFVLRLFRVETVTRSLFVSTTRPSSKLFLSNSPARSLLFAIRIQTSHFINAFAGYTFDTAIGRNWKIFLRRLERLKTQSQSSRSFAETATRQNEEERNEEDHDDETEAGAELKDIFALVSYHSTILDRILAACFLRSNQQPLYKLLMRCFTDVLSFGKLVRDLQTEELEEDEVVSQLRELQATFESSTTKFLHAVSLLDARATTSPQFRPSSSSGEVEDQDLLALISGEDQGAGAGFADLVMRLDFEGVGDGRVGGEGGRLGGMGRDDREGLF